MNWDSEIHSPNKASWQFWIDTGGTFTDALGKDPQGQIHRAKVLSSSSLRGPVKKAYNSKEFTIQLRERFPPNFFRGFIAHSLDTNQQRQVIFSENSNIQLEGSIDASEQSLIELSSPEEAPLLAIRLMTQKTLDEKLPPIQLRLATTRGTNALLEYKGAPTLLFVTQGFRDLLKIGNQQRPDLFALKVIKPKTLTDHIIEVEERLDSQGNIICDLNLEKLALVLQKIKGPKPEVAISLMHSYVNGIHEEKLASFLKDKGFDSICLSSQLAPYINYLQRTQSVTVNATLTPIIRTYLKAIEEKLPDRSLHVMTSAGSLIKSSEFEPLNSLLSGPAGGIVGASQTALASNLNKIITFDMGGTSTDVSRFEDDYDYAYSHQVGLAEVSSPALAIETVAAGGGSICWFDGQSLRVGPQSAGAQPGPACYGAGGPLTVTDVNLLLGRLATDGFEIPIDLNASQNQFDELLQEIKKSDQKITQEEALSGFLSIANETMAGAIKKISLRKGYDPKDYALVAFGGAGGQHACAVAQKLGMRKILIPKDAGLLSASGLGRARIERFAKKQILGLLEDFENDLEDAFLKLSKKVKAALEDEGIKDKEISLRHQTVTLRIRGQDASFDFEFKKDQNLKDLFLEKYQHLYGIDPQASELIEIESITVLATGPQIFAPKSEKPTNSDFSNTPDDKKQNIPIYERSSLKQGEILPGPCLIKESHGLTVVEKSWSLKLDNQGALVLSLLEKPNLEKSESQSQAVALELFTHRFTQVAQEMGETLRRTTVSTNVRERLDFSCALLDAQGRLIVNAPHIPVHLGAMGECVRRVCQEINFKKGDVVVTNHPAYGGSHLPDVTLISPIVGTSGRLIGYVANRAHHAEIGGLTPGSMPPGATLLAQEGVVIPPTFLIREGHENWQEIQNLLCQSSYPSRAVSTNLADLKAALAAAKQGVKAMEKLLNVHGEDLIGQQMEALRKKSKVALQQALGTFEEGSYQACEELDDGSKITVNIHLKKNCAEIDFTGSSLQHSGNLNTSRAVVTSCVMYFLRLLIQEELPLNEGLMEAINLRLPKGFLNPSFSNDPQKSPAVVGGNVETSQRVVDTLLKALNLAGCSQGTMNNVIFGNDYFSYYETVCGGCGAGPDHIGASAVHSHMTNTRITDPEILEWRYPVRLEQFQIRAGSGGNGKFKGGDGVLRVIKFLEDVELSVLAQHRKQAPYGIDGGESGACGQQWAVRKNQEKVFLSGNQSIALKAGETFFLETPGGGGYSSR